MKNFIFFLFVAYFSLATIAQESPWIVQKAIGLPNSINPPIFFSAVNENICWGINNNNSQFLRTTNGGMNWLVDTISGATGLYCSSISAIDINTAYVAMDYPTDSTNGGIFKTSDGGLTWAKQITVGHPVEIHFFNSNDGVVIGYPVNGNWEIYTTINGGTLWNRVPTEDIPLPNFNIILRNGLSATGNCIWFGTEGPIPDSHWLYRSTDKGLSWTAIATNFTNCIAFKDSLNGIALHMDDSFAKTTDGGFNWTNLQNKPSTSAQFISYVKATTGSYVITSSTNFFHSESPSIGSSYSIDDGKTWQKVDNKPHGRAEFVSFNVGWSSGMNDTIYKWSGDLLTSTENNLKQVTTYSLEQNYPNP